MTMAFTKLANSVTAVLKPTSDDTSCTPTKHVHSAISPGRRIDLQGKLLQNYSWYIQCLRTVPSQLTSLKRDAAHCLSNWMYWTNHRYSGLVWSMLPDVVLCARHAMSFVV